jgi:hypothetical protein
MFILMLKFISEMVTTAYSHIDTNRFECTVMEISE